MKRRVHTGAKFRFENQKNRNDNFWFFTKHPLVILIVGGVVSGLAIPWISGAIESRSRSASIRENAISGLFTKSSRVESDLNIFVSECEAFLKIAQRFTFQKDKKGFDEYSVLHISEIKDSYKEFNRDAWWWIGLEAKRLEVMGLIDRKQSSDVEIIVEAYSDSLEQSIKYTTRITDIIGSISYGDDLSGGEVEVGGLREKLKVETEFRFSLVSCLAEQVQ